MNLYGFDLNLLKVLDAVMQDGSTVAAGRRLGLSQSAVSAALGRLRLSLDDPLFVRQGQSLVPTDFALSLEVPLREALDGLENLLSAGQAFDPARDTARFMLAGSGYFADLLMPRLARLAEDEAPHVRFQMIELSPSSYLEPVRSGRADLGLIPEFALTDWADHAPVLISEFLVIARRGHPSLGDLDEGQTIPLDLFCETGHVLYSAEGKTRTQSDAALAQIGRSRRVVMTVAQFSGAYRVVSESNLISVLPAELALSVAGPFGLKTYRLPVQVGPVSIVMAWHRRTTTSAHHIWLRKTVSAILADLSKPAPLHDTRPQAIHSPT